MRILLLLSGFISLGLAILGIVLPLLPTTPFLLLSAFCFARSSDKFHAWLINHRYFGEMIRDWQNGGVINRRTKIRAMAMIVCVFLISYFLNMPSHVLIIQAVVLGCVSVFILSRPSENK